MSHAIAEAVESLHDKLDPIEALQGEHTQLESWVHDSFSALEKLHRELTEWQSELARKQTELDLREDAISRTEAETVGGDAAHQIATWRQRLNESQQETRQLESESAEQLQELENMELQMVQLEKELNSARKRILELTQLLESERCRASEEQHQWQGEFRDMRRLLEKQCTLLEDRIRDSRESAELDPDADPNEEGTLSRTAELRRRAKSRRVAKLRKHQEEEAQD